MLEFQKMFQLRFLRYMDSSKKCIVKFTVQSLCTMDALRTSGAQINDYHTVINCSSQSREKLIISTSTRKKRAHPIIVLRKRIGGMYLSKNLFILEHFEYATLKFLVQFYCYDS